MKFPTYALITLSLIVGWFAVAWAQPAASEKTAPEVSAVTLDELLHILREQSPRTAADNTRIAVAEAAVIGAGLLPNPSLSYGVLQLVQGANTGAFAQHQATLEVPLLLFGQRGVRRKVAERGVAVARAEAALRFAERALELRQGFATLLASQERTQLLREAARDLGQFETIIRGRAAAGDKSQYDVLRISLETRALDSELAAAAALLADAAGQVARLVGRPAWYPRATGSLAPTETALRLLTGSSLAPAQHPGIEAARRRELAAAQGITLARRERFPLVSIQAGVVGTVQENSVSILGGIGAPLPLFDRGQGQLARAHAEHTAARLDHDATVAEIGAELTRARQVFTSRRDATQRLAHDVFERLPAVRQLAELSYRQGKSGLVDLLDAFRTLKGLRDQYLDAQLDAKRAENEMLYAAGQLEYGWAAATGS